MIQRLNRNEPRKPVMPILEAFRSFGSAESCLQQYLKSLGNYGDDAISDRVVEVRLQLD